MSPGWGFPSLPCTFACQLQRSLTYHSPTQDQSFLLILGHLRSSTLPLPPVAGRTRAEANPGFCMSPGKGLITDCHLLDPQIKLPGCSWPAGRRPDPLPGVLRAARKSPSPGALCQFHCRGFYHQNEVNSTPNIPPHAVIKVEILGIIFLLIYIRPPPGS